jgi:hypothetical protein
VTCPVYRNEEYTAVAACKRRNGNNNGVKCGFSVRAEKENGRWVVKTSMCNWEHDHDAEGVTIESSSASEEDEGEVRSKKGPKVANAISSPRQGASHSSWFSFSSAPHHSLTLFSLA